MADETVTQPEAAPTVERPPVAAQPAAAPIETRANFVVVKPIADVAPDGVIVALAPEQAKQLEAFVRPAESIDLSRWAKAPLAL